MKLPPGRETFPHLTRYFEKYFWINLPKYISIKDFSYETFFLPLSKDISWGRWYNKIGRIIKISQISSEDKWLPNLKILFFTRQIKLIRLKNLKGSIGATSKKIIKYCNSSICPCNTKHEERNTLSFCRTLNLFFRKSAC